MNLDRLILYRSRHVVNPKIPAPGNRSQPAAHPASARAGGTVCGRTAGGAVEGPEPDFDAPGAAQAGRPGGRPAYGKELFLSAEGAARTDGPAARGRERDPRIGAGPRCAAAGAAQAPRPDAALLRR